MSTLFRTGQEQEKRDADKPKEQSENVKWLKEKRAKLDELKDLGSNARRKKQRIELNCLKASVTFQDLQIMALRSAAMGRAAREKVGLNLLNGIPADEGYKPQTLAELRFDKPEDVPQLSIDKNSGVITVYLNKELEGGKLIRIPTIVRAQTAERKGRVTWVCTFEGEAIDLPFIPEYCLPKK